MSDYFGPRTPPGTVFSASSHPPSKDKAVLRGEPFRKYAVEAILTDLIAELREAPHPHEYRGNYAHDAADRAEARLRELNKE